MGGVELLYEARMAGLDVKRDGGKLVVRGPRGSEELANRLMDNKRAVMAALLVDGVFDYWVERRGSEFWHVLRRRGESVYPVPNSWGP